MRTQAWGWLVAAVLAAGLNATYHDGGMQWAHRIADHVQYNTTAVMALATGHADQFLQQARFVNARRQSGECPFNETMARVNAELARSQAHWDVMSAREEVQLARLQANRDSMEAQLAQMRIPAVNFAPVVVRTRHAYVCPRVKVNVPRIPNVKVPEMPVVRVNFAGAGPV
jgi:hypothetical protein